MNDNPSSSYNAAIMRLHGSCMEPLDSWRIRRSFTLPPPPEFPGSVHRGSGAHPGNRSALEGHAAPSACSGHISRFLEKDRFWQLYLFAWGECLIPALWRRALPMGADALSSCWSIHFWFQQSRSLILHFTWSVPFALSIIKVFIAAILGLFILFATGLILHRPFYYYEST